MIKLIEAENRMVIDRNWGNRARGSCCSMGITLQLYEISSRDLLDNIVPLVTIMVLCI